MKNTFLTIFLMALGSIALAQNQQLYKIIKQKKYGFIDVTGAIKIEPKFNNARQFKEGLAAVREHDKYGYIDEQGNYVIPPQYEMAESFSCGLAVVYTKGKPFVINKQNKKIVDTVYKTIEAFSNGFAHVSSKNDLWGVVDSLGNEVIKPQIIVGIFFDDEYAIIRKQKKGADLYDSDYGVIDRKYQIVLPFGKYIYIDSYGNDLFFVQDKNGNHFINKYGKEISKDDKRFEYNMLTHFSNGLAIVNVIEKLDSKNQRAYSSIIDTSGKIIFRDTTTYTTAIQFDGKYAYVQQTDNLFWAINKNGEKKLIDSIETIETNKTYGAIYKSKNGLYGIIDNDGNLIAKARFSWLFYSKDIDKFYFHENVNDSIFKFGFCDRKGNIAYINDDKLKHISNFTKDGLAYDINYDEEMVALYNNKLEKVWQLTPKYDSLKTLNIDFKYRTNYEQKEQSYNFKDAFYNFGNKMKKFPFNNEKGKLSFKILNNVTDTFVNSFYGHPVYLFNNTQKNLTYLSMDFEAPIILQAKNEKGIWQDIAPIKVYHGHNTNTYMKSTLSPNAYLKFTIPTFEGAFKTKLRVVFEYNIRDDKKYYYQWVTKRLYSNEMDVFINPAQFYYETTHHFPSAHTESYFEMLLQ